MRVTTPSTATAVLSSLPPEQRHQSHEGAILAHRQAVYEQAKTRHPERWSGPTRNWQPLTEVWLNPSAAVLDSPTECSQNE